MHGRKERRSVSVYDELIGISKEWRGIQRLIRVERHTSRGGRETHETSFYISSVRSDSAEYFGRLIRVHWGIENRLHWVKDVIMMEDLSRTVGGEAAPSISLMRNVAINLFRLNGHDSIKQATQHYVDSFNDIWELIHYDPANKKKT